MAVVVSGGHETGSVVVEMFCDVYPGQHDFRGTLSHYSLLQLEDLEDLDAEHYRGCRERRRRELISQSKRRGRIAAGA